MALSGKKVYGALKGEIDSISQKLDDAIVGIFTPGGSLEFEDLPELSADVLGFVYEITNDFTTTSDFVEGVGIDYPAGTKVAVVNRGTEQSPEYMFDVTTGAIEVDSDPTANSGNPVSSGGVYTALESKANTADLGTAASKSSTNAVTADSTALVESGAVYTALTNKTGNTIVSDIESTTTASKAYAVDDYLMLNNILYKVTSAISSGGTIVTSGAGANVVAVKITDEIGQGGGADLTILAPEFNTTTAYGVGDYVTYDGSLYRFTSMHTAGAWDSTQVTDIKAVGQYVTAGKKSETILGGYATAEGFNTEASGDQSHAEGNGAKARGNNSHAEGRNTTASGTDSHAEGLTTTASNGGSHAEGYFTIASGMEGSHAEGNSTEASGASSHASGSYTIAQRKSQTVIGEYNIADNTGEGTYSKGYYVFIIGNGNAEDERSNALTVDWDGNLEVAGKIKASNIHGEWTLAGSLSNVAGSTDQTDFSISTFDGKEVLLLFYIDREDVDTRECVITLKYSAFEFSRILALSPMEEDGDTTILWRGFCSGYPLDGGSATVTEGTLSRYLSRIWACCPGSNTVRIGARGAASLYDWHLEIYTR